MPHRISVRTEALADAITTAGLDHASTADAMSITQSALDEVRTGRALPDSEFIAGALIAFEPLPFEALFEISGHSRSSCS